MHAYKINVVRANCLELSYTIVMMSCEYNSCFMRTLQNARVNVMGLLYKMNINKNKRENVNKSILFIYLFYK